MNIIESLILCHGLCKEDAYAALRDARRAVAQGEDATEVCEQWLDISADHARELTH